MNPSSFTHSDSGNPGFLRGRRAFTLLEIMVAMAIFSMISIGIYTSWNAIITASRIGLKAAAEAQRKRNALESVQTALFGAQMYTANIHHHYFLADTANPDAALLSFVSQLPESFPGSGLFPNDPVRRVTFTIDTDNKGVRNLILYQTPVLASVEDMSEPIPIRLAQNVAMFSAEFYDQDLGEWMVDWESTNSLPRQVRFAIEFENRDKDNNLLAQSDLETRVVTIPNTAIPIQIQRPSIAGGNRVTGGPQDSDNPDGADPANPRSRRDGNPRDGNVNRNPQNPGNRAPNQNFRGGGGR